MRWAYIMVAAVLGAVAWGASPRTADGPTGMTVTIRNLQFTPAAVQIKIGESVTWTNSDDRDHTVNAGDGSFRSGNIKPGASFSHRFTSAGTINYGCSYHPRMRGSVQVSE